MFDPDAVSNVLLAPATPNASLHWPFVGLAAFMGSATLVPIIRWWALRSNVMDVPNERSSHQVAKPRIGGVGLVFGAAMGIAVSLLAEGRFKSEESGLIGLLLGMAGVGLVDDLKGLTVAKRMSLYLLGALGIAWFCFPISTVAIPPLFSVQLPSPLATGFTTLFIAWYANLFNFMDGTDGIAGGAATVTCGALALVFAREDNLELMAISLSLSAACLGFLLHNYAPSSIFMGDVGSVFLGTATGGLTAASVALGYVSLTAGVLCMFPFVFDASFTLARRATSREKVWQAHRSHIYQQMCDIGFSHRNVCIVYTIGAAAFAAAGLLYDKLPGWAQITIFCSSLALGVFSAHFVLSRNTNREAASSAF